MANIAGIMIFAIIFNYLEHKHSPALADYIYNAFGKAKLYEVGTAIKIT
nr:hypothetical protein [Entomoplasma sp. MP1]